MTWLISISFFLSLIASVADGMVEGFEFDGRKSFERKKGVDKNSFWGSLSHQNKETLWFRVTGGVFDFYHVADDLRSWGYRIAGAGLGAFIAVGLTNGTDWKILALIAASFFLKGILAKRVSMWWVRK